MASQLYLQKTAIASSVNSSPSPSDLPTFEQEDKNCNMAPYLGVYCDGPFCINNLNRKAIESVLFRCVERPDTDFCASCLLTPQNLHSQSFHGHLVFQQPPGLIQWREEYEELSDALCEKGKGIGELVQCISAAQTIGGVSSKELENVAELLEDVQFLVSRCMHSLQVSANFNQIKQASCAAKAEMPLLWDLLQIKYKVCSFADHTK